MTELEQSILSEFRDKDIHPYNFKTTTNMKKILVEKYRLEESKLEFIPIDYEAGKYKCIISDDDNKIVLEVFCEDSQTCRIHKEY